MSRPAHLLFRALTCIALSASSFACTGDIGQGAEHQTEGPPLRYDDYEVLFTNPVCKAYPYGQDQQVYSVGGERLTQKPLGAFCTKDDAAASGAQTSSPQYRLSEWIADENTTEIFFAALSFSNSVITKALCEAVETRSVKVRFVLDQNSDRTRADQLLACQPASGDPADAPEMLSRGHEGNINLQHNKLVMINPGQETMRIAFGSGNMSSGLVLHHENWHFITLPRSTYFAQAHLCLMDGLVNYATSKGVFSEFIRECRSAIDGREEGDIKAMFVPGEGGRATQHLMSGIERAESIDIAAHRFTHSTLVKRFQQRLAGPRPPAVRMVADDDLYWVGHGERTGGNEAFEYDHVTSIVELGAEARYVETNHDAHLLHHNKAMIFRMPGSEPDAVFCGAGNFTKTAMRNNFENFYLVRINHVVDRFAEQFEHLYLDLATKPVDMPQSNVLPPH